MNNCINKQDFCFTAHSLLFWLTLTTAGNYFQSKIFENQSVWSLPNTEEDNVID